MSNSLLHWVGGKQAIIGEIMKRIPKTMNNYIEPCVGGGSVLLAVLERWKEGRIVITGGIYAYDSNPHLINFYHFIQTKPRQLFKETTKIFNEYMQSNDMNKAFYDLRDEFNALPPQGIRSAAILEVLNKTGYHGLYRVNKQGKYNVSYGKYRKPCIFTWEALQRISKLLRQADVKFQVQDIIKSLQSVKQGDYVFVDPPYTSTYENYTMGAFPRSAFVQAVHQMSENGICFSVCDNQKGIEVFNNMKNIEKVILTQKTTIRGKGGLTTVMLNAR